MPACDSSPGVQPLSGDRLSLPSISMSASLMPHDGAVNMSLALGFQLRPPKLQYRGRALQCAELTPFAKLGSLKQPPLACTARVGCAVKASSACGEPEKCVRASSFSFSAKDITNILTVTDLRRGVHYILGLVSSEPIQPRRGAPD